ncbi:MAG: ATP-binding protein [Actinomycetota bacterium]
MSFVNRTGELAALDRWWSTSTGIALVWGRRRVGKTALIQRFARGKPTVFHTGAGRPLADELRILTDEATKVADLERRNARIRPFTDWDDALAGLADVRSPSLLILDEFPELTRTYPALPSVLRAWLDRERGRTALRILVCGSAVRTMEAMQDERSPLFGRIDLPLLVHPFRPREASTMLRVLDPASRALVWGVAGGMPLYLSWWDQTEPVRSNLDRLVCAPGAPMLTEGQLVLATEGESGELGGLVLRAIAAGRTKHHEIEQAVRAEPARTLDRLAELRLVERVVPITENPRRTKRTVYRIADNFLRFWLTLVERHRGEIERGLGGSIVGSIERGLDDHMGAAWEEAFRDHLRHLAVTGQMPEEVEAIGPWWDRDGENEIDAVALAGVDQAAILVGEAKWARGVNGARIVSSLTAKAGQLPAVRKHLELAVCAREEIKKPPPGARTYSAVDLFP